MVRRGGQGRGRGGLSHRSCIVNEKLFTNQILFHRRPGDQASLMERWMDRCDGRKLFNLTPEVSGLSVKRNSLFLTIEEMEAMSGV